jgi:hypothetical protein
VDRLSRLGIDEEMPLADCFVLPQAGRRGGGNVGEAIEEFEIVSVFFAGQEPSDTIPWRAAEIADDFCFWGSRWSFDEEAAEFSGCDCGFEA